jgi:hypothetical protein
VRFCIRVISSARVMDVLALGPDDEQERRAGLLLLGKGAISAHRLDWPRAAGLDEYEQQPPRDVGRDARCSVG